jgi:CMP-N-acetylneuraminic acid synthetase
MNILGLIPARGGSKGVPNKNIKLLGGKALITYSIDAGLASKSMKKLVVSTDSEKIAEVSRNAGAEVPFLRPAALATDASPTIDTVIHAVQFYEKKGIDFDAICLLQPTSPFRTASDIEKAINVFKIQNADSLVSVREVPHQYNPHWVYEPTSEGSFLKIATGEEQIIPRRQELPKAYHRDGSIYIVKKKILLEQRSLYGKKIAFHVSENPVYVNIDTLEDWAEAEAFLQKNKTFE